MAIENNSKPQTRTYVLANPKARKSIDLTKHKELLNTVIHTHIPDAVVTVYEHSYTVYGITKGDAIKIGRSLSQCFDEEAFLKRMCLFISSQGETFKEYKPKP